MWYQGADHFQQQYASIFSGKGSTIKLVNTHLNTGNQKCEGLAVTHDLNTVFLGASTAPRKFRVGLSMDARRCQMVPRAKVLYNIVKVTVQHKMGSLTDVAQQKFAIARPPRSKSMSFHHDI